VNNKMRLALTILAIGLIVASSLASLAASQTIATRTITETATKYTTTTMTITTGTRTLTRAITHTRTEYTTKTRTVTYTVTETMEATRTRTTTVTTTITARPGPDIRITSLKSMQLSYRPGEYIRLKIGFRNVGDPGNVRVCYGVNTPYLGDRWVTKCVDLGYMRSGETKYATDENTVFATCMVGGCVSNARVKLLYVNDRPPLDSSEKDIEVRVTIDERIKLDWTGPAMDYVTEGLRKGEARSYLISIISGPSGGTTVVELTVKRLDGGWLDWDEKADLRISRYGKCPQNEEPLIFFVKKGWKKFELTMVKIDGTIKVEDPPIVQTEFERVRYTAGQGFKLPWDSTWYVISKVCIWQSK